MPEAVLEHLKAVGLEVEGGWETRPDRVETDDDDDDESDTDGDWSHRNNAVLHGDGSVAVGIGWDGEIVCLNPLEPSRAKLDRWTKRIWPDGFNHTCGLHVHLSTKTDRGYLSIATMDFYKEFLKWCAREAKQLGVLTDVFKKRLDGDNHYCKKLKDAREINAQILDRHKSDTRYRHLNFCRSLHGTLENRTFPMMEREKAVELIARYLSFTNEYISQNLESIAEIRHSIEGDLARPNKTVVVIPDVEETLSFRRILL